MRVGTLIQFCPPAKQDETRMTTEILPGVAGLAPALILFQVFVYGKDFFFARDLRANHPKDFLCCM